MIILFIKINIFERTLQQFSESHSQRQLRRVLSSQTADQIDHTIAKMLIQEERLII